jgi:uncharacterized protein
MQQLQIAVVVNVVAFGLVLAWLARRARAGGKLSTRVLLAVVLGVACGGLLQAVYGLGSATVRATLEWVAIVGSGYVRLLQMVIAPLVLISITAAVSGLRNVRSLGAVSASVLGVLLLTTAIAALVGVTVAGAFGLRADGLVRGARELEKGAALTAKVGEAASLTIPALLQSFVPNNVFADLAGARPTWVVGIVVFAALLGAAALALRAEQPEVGARIQQGIETLQALVARLVRIVIRLTPYGVLALMTRVVASASVRDVVQLGAFVAASYAGLAAVLAVHAALVALAGVSPARFYRQAWPALTFAFTSRSSAATIPLSVETQVDRLGVAPAIAHLAASLGATIGQNACAGLYPAMLAVMIAPSVGIDPTSWSFVGSVVVVAALGSFGIAGVGGGATFAALVVLSTLNLPVALAGLLISVEPLIDMGRTAVNVSGALVAGTVTSRLLRQTDPAVLGTVNSPPAREQAVPGEADRSRAA